jgi:hypothetical protein
MEASMGKSAGKPASPRRPFPARSKYGAKKTEIDGIIFDSKKEAERWLFLRGREAAGEINCLERQLSFVFTHNHVKICTYRCDFAYFDLIEKRRVYEDVKGFRTPLYRLKLKMLHAFYPMVLLREV